MSYIGNSPTTTAFVTDSFSGTGAQIAFTMSLAPATTSSILVSITGVLQDPSTYSVSGTTLTFSSPPPLGTGNISVRYLGIPASGVTTTAYRTVTEFTATAGQTTFNTPSYTVGYIDVYRNGARLGAADYTATTGTTVVLASGASAGDLVVTESFYVSSVLNAIPATAGAVNSTYLVDGGVTQAKLGAGVAGNGPAFSAYMGTGQTLSATTYTKLQINTKEFDTDNSYDETTNYRFQPNIGGYYLISGKLDYSAAAAAQSIVAIYKNGTAFKRGTFTNSCNAAVVSALVYMNGSSDYVELYGYVGTGLTLNAGVSYTYFQGALVRAA